MGYGTGMELTLDVENGYGEYNGRNITLKDVEVKSWDWVGDVHAMRNIKPSMLKVTFESVKLDQEDRDWFKNRADIKKWDVIYIEWDNNPSVQVFGGHTRSSLDNSFPVYAVGQADVQGLGMRDVTVKIERADKERFKNFFDDLVEYCVDDEERKAFLDDAEDERYANMSEEDLTSMLYKWHDDDLESNYRVK